MIRRLFMLLSAVVKRGRTIQDMVAKTWPWMNVVPGFATAAAGANVPDVAEPERVPRQPVAPAAPAVAAAPVAPLLAPDVPATAPVAAPAPQSAAAPPAMPPLGAKAAVDGSVWLSRILWALEYSRRHELGPQSASDIARVLVNAGLNVPSTNVARAFRVRKEQQDAPEYWSESGEQRYAITDAGRTALAEQLGT